MKKVVCLGLVVLLLMNTIGYYAIFWGFQVHSDRRLTHQLDNDSYDQANAITFKVPISIPYLMDQSEFSRADGKFLNEGKYYRMVKQRYAQDTLTIVCVRDTNTEQIQTALGDYVKTFADNPQQTSKHSKAPLSIIKDFIDHSSASITGIEGWTRDVPQTSYSISLYSSHTASINQPPERV